MDVAVIRVSAVRLSTHTSRHLGGERVHTPKKTNPKIPTEPSSSLFVFKSTPLPTVVNIPAGLAPRKRPVPISKVAGSCSLQTQVHGVGEHGEFAALLGVGCWARGLLLALPTLGPSCLLRLGLGAGSWLAGSRRETTETACPPSEQNNSSDVEIQPPTMGAAAQPHIHRQSPRGSGPAHRGQPGS